MMNWWGIPSYDVDDIIKMGKFLQDLEKHQYTNKEIKSIGEKLNEVIDNHNRVVKMITGMNEILIYHVVGLKMDAKTKKSYEKLAQDLLDKRKEKESE